MAAIYDELITAAATCDPALWEACLAKSPQHTVAAHDIPRELYEATMMALEKPLMERVTFSKKSLEHAIQCAPLDALLPDFKVCLAHSYELMLQRFMWKGCVPEHLIDDAIDVMKNNRMIAVSFGRQILSEPAYHKYITAFSISVLAELGYFEFAELWAQPLGDAVNDEFVWAILTGCYWSNNALMATRYVPLIRNKEKRIEWALAFGIREHYPVAPHDWTPKQIFKAMSYNDQSFNRALLESQRHLIPLPKNFYDVRILDDFTLETMALYKQYFGPPPIEVWANYSFYRVDTAERLIESGLWEPQELSGRHCYDAMLGWMHRRWRRGPMKMPFLEGDARDDLGRLGPQVRFWNEYQGDLHLRASVWFYAIVMVSDGLLTVEGGAIGAPMGRFLHIASCLPVELQWELAKVLIGTRGRYTASEAGLHWLLQLLS
jgi:hypothetical protein